ncbi:MAG: efflux RND transporter periplasmic adaptor subunit [Burkholderiaceae bacterium]
MAQAAPAVSHDHVDDAAQTGPQVRTVRARSQAPESSRRVRIERKADAPEIGNPANLILEIQQRVSQQADFRRMAAALCAALQTGLKAERVSLGWQRHGADPEQPPVVVATSNGDPNTLSRRVERNLIAAMDEACLQQCSMSSLGQRSPRRIDAAQRALAALNGRTVITVPLAIDQVCVGAVCIEMRAEALPASSIGTAARLVGLIRFVEQVLSACTRLLAMASQADAPWWHLVRARRQRENRDPKTRRRRRLWQIGGAVFAIALLIPFEQPVTSEARLEGAVEREVAAVTAGTIESVLVRPGDKVEKGQTLAVLSTRELMLERNRSEAEFEEQLGLMNAAIATGDRTGMAAAQARMQQIRAQADLLSLQIQQASIQAPIAGTVLKGDLADKLDTPIERGQTLFTIAPDDELRVIIEVAEHDIDAVKSAQAGELALSAMPWQRFKLKVDRIAPTATLIENRNVVEVRAQLIEQAGSSKPGQLKPGLRGAVHLQSVRGSLLGRWSTRLTDSAARLWWRWRPW